MGIASSVRHALKPPASYVRPTPLSALALFYAIGGTVLFLEGLLGRFDARAYLLGTFVLGPGAARTISLLFGAGLALVGWGFWRLNRIAWMVFICAAWVGAALDVVWLVVGLAHGAAFRFAVCLLVDGLLLVYVYMQRQLFIH